MLHSVMPYGFVFSDGTDWVIGQPSCYEAPDPMKPQAILSTDPFAFLPKRSFRR